VLAQFHDGSQTRTEKPGSFLPGFGAKLWKAARVLAIPL
jgi:hypothetical protein